MGGDLMMKMKNKTQKRPIIEVELEDNNVVGHLFLKYHGFKCVKILWGGNNENDLYIFQYDVNVSAQLP
jgi:hypothetical protein